MGPRVLESGVGNGHGKTFMVGECRIEPELHRVVRGEEVTHLRPQVMELLVYFAERPGRVVGPQELLENLWRGKVVTDSSVYNCVTELRRALEAAGTTGPYIETIPKSGYRLVAETTELQDGDTVATVTRVKRKYRRWATGFVGVAALAALALLVGRQHGTPARMPAANAGQPAETLSIAVLPFRDLSPDHDQAWFSDGIAEELLTALSKIPRLRVISGTSSFALRDTGLSGPEIGTALDVNYLLEGSALKSDERVRITAQLIDTRSDSHLWSQTFDRPITDVFAVQNEISARLAEELKVELLGSPPTVSETTPKAFDLVLEGRYLVSTRLKDNLHQAAELFRRAIGIDAAYAPSYAGLAKALWLEADMFGEAEARQPASDALERALTLDPEDSDALATKGVMLRTSDRATSRDYLERAIVANPSNSDAYRWLALSYEHDDPRRYLELVSKGYSVDPMIQDMNFHLIVALNRFGRYGEAVRHAQEFNRRFQGRGGSFVLAGQARLLAGRLDAALLSDYGGYRVEPDEPIFMAVPWRLMELGEPALAETWVAALSAPSSLSGDMAARAAWMQVAAADMLGNHREATALIEAATRRHAESWWLIEIARMHERVSGDFQTARELWERGLANWGRGALPSWRLHWIADYALALQRTGEGRRAAELIDESLAEIDRERAAGMLNYADYDTEVFQYEAWSLGFYAAMLHALHGDSQQALDALRQDAARGGTQCTLCLRRWPHFDSLRGNPDFEALLADATARLAKEHEYLADERLLLTPDEVLAHGDFAFDTFAASPAGP